MGDSDHEGLELLSLARRTVVPLYLSLVCGTAVEHVSEAAMQPSLAGRIVMPAVDEFIEHVCVIASEAEHLLLEASGRFDHEILIALIPQRCSVNSSVRGITVHS